jgi:hypothetical protein
MIVRCSNGILEGKVYCRKKDIAGYLADMINMSSGAVKVAIREDNI